MDLVSRENLAQFEDSPEGAEPVGLQVTVVEQQEVTSLGYSLFAMWLSSSLELQLAAQVRALHEPADVEDQLQRQQATWNALRRAVRSFVFDEELDSTTAAAAPQTGDPGDRRLAASGSRPDVTPRQDSEERNVASDGLGDGGLAAAGGLPTAAPRRDLLIADLVMYLRSVVVRSGEFSVEEVLLDELTAVQELASWQEPLTSVGLWSPEDLAGQQTETTMKDDLWQALESANASAPQMRTAARFGAARIPGLPILDPPTVQSRNQLIREDQPYYIAAGFIKLFPLGQGDYWAQAAGRRPSVVLGVAAAFAAACGRPVSSAPALLLLCAEYGLAQQGAAVSQLLCEAADWHERQRAAHQRGALEDGQGAVHEDRDRLRALAAVLRAGENPSALRLGSHGGADRTRHVRVPSAGAGRDSTDGCPGMWRRRPAPHRGRRRVEAVFAGLPALP